MSNYTVAEGLAVLEETKRLLAEDDRRRPDFRTARASANNPPPQLEFADIILRQQEENPDLSLSEAVRLATIDRPDLHKEWVAKENAKMRNEEQTKKDAAARFRSRNR